MSGPFAEKVPLIKEGAPPPEKESKSSSEEEDAMVAQSLLMRNIKTVSLALLVIQNSAQFLVTGYSRRPPEHGESLYLVSVAVLLAEVGKGALCCVVIAWTSGGLPGLVEQIQEDIIGKPVETIKVGVPAFCYTLQNNLLFVALSNLAPAVCQVLYQTKTLSTALFSVLLMQKQIGGLQWFALFLLVVGVVLVQYKDDASASSSDGSNPIIGLIAVACCSLLSGFAGVFLEKMLKGARASLWVRNIQLCLFSVPLQILAIVQKDYAAVAERGLLHGFTGMAWGVVLINTCGGLLVAVVIKYADNILKTFATVLAIVCSCFLSMTISAFNFKPTSIFFVGVAVVFASIFLYSWRPNKPLTSYLPLFNRDYNV